jgi:t-SNARE complex subunit (syntaxin)
VHAAEHIDQGNDELPEIKAAAERDRPTTKKQWCYIKAILVICISVVVLFY